MLLLVSFLIFFFFILISYQLLDYLFRKKIREGAKNNSDDSDDSGDLEQTVQDLSGNVSELQTQVNGILQAQQQYANQMAPSEPTITGALD
jgi:hypothetical protein